MKLRTWLISSLFCLLAAGQSSAGPVLIISIDGLRPDYVLGADAHGLKIPTLRRFLTEGAYAEGVVGVVPTVTYPSHTTLVTGVWPSEHGIEANLAFEPSATVETWNWYAQDIKVPTLWDAAEKGGIVTASVSWPVTVGANSVKYLIPEYWRTRTDNDHKLMEAISRPNGLLAEMETTLGPYDESSDQGLRGDRIRAKFAQDILIREKPGFMTVHLAALDHVEHLTGPFSKESDETLEAIDEMVRSLMQGALANDPTSVVAVVSDHGFLPVDRRINLLLPFIQDGLIRVKSSRAMGTAAIASWDAILWPAGGSAAVMMRDPSDVVMKERVKRLLFKMKGDPANAIARVIEQPALAEMGGFPDAAFLVEMKPGAEIGGALTDPHVSRAPATGTHGYLPDRPEMRASFFIMGSRIAAARDLGVIDMRQIAPTIAAILDISLPAATAEKLSVFR